METTGAQNEGRFARKRFTLPQFSSFARLCPALFFSTGLAIAPVPAEAQMIGFGGFGIGGGLGALGLIHHGFGGGFGTGRGSGPPRFMSHGGPGFGGRGFQGGPPWGRGQSQLRQPSRLGAYGGGQRNYGHWPSHGQPSQVGTREFPARGNCGGGPCPPTDFPWRGQGHSSKVGTTEVPPGRRPAAVAGTKTGQAAPQGAYFRTKIGTIGHAATTHGAGGETTTGQGGPPTEYTRTKIGTTGRPATRYGAGGGTTTGQGGTTNDGYGTGTKTGQVTNRSCPESGPYPCNPSPTRCSGDKPCTPPPPPPWQDNDGVVTLQFPQVWFPLPQGPGGGAIYPPSGGPGNVPPPINPAGPPPLQGPKPPTNQHTAPPPPIEPPRIARGPDPRPSGVPPNDEHRYIPDEVLFELAAGVSPQTADAIARRQRLQRLASQPLELIGTTLYRYRIKDKRSVPTVVAALERDARIGTVQPNYLYRLQQGDQNGSFTEKQYAVPEMHLPEAHRISNGEKTLVAVIDSGIDSTHPEILGTITESYDATDDGKREKATHGTEAAGMVHGTEVAGIIASHADLTGVAPQAHILAVRAFAKVGTSWGNLLGTQWAVTHRARVVNMSFAGPHDPFLARVLFEATRRGVIFIAAVGNEGNAAKPSYPAAYDDVIAVTATDREDAIFKDASRCMTTCVAAPGVDILSAAPARAYRYDSGTSMAAAQVSGVVALLLDAKPGLDPKAVRDLLVQTAKHLSRPDWDEKSIAGIVDAYATLEAAAAPGPLGENAAPIIEQRSVGPSDSAGRPAAKDAELPRNPPPVDPNSTGSLKDDAQPDSKGVATATDAELTRKEEVLKQLKKDGLISMDQFQHQLQDLEAAKTIFINKCPAAPHVPGVVNAEFQESDRARAIALIRDYGLEAKFIDSVELAKITVPAGQEWSWVVILKASGLFTRVEREDYSCLKSVDTEFGIGHPDIALPAPAVSIPPAAELEDVVAILKKKYPKPSEVRVIERHQNLVKVEISGLRGSVLSGHNYWERLEIHLVILKPGEAEAMVEGSYAPGIGDSPPATSAYESMEKEYYSDLLRFTKLTFANLQQ